MKVGDVSRRRRFADPVRMRWYAHYRAVRFSRRCLCMEVAPVRSACASGSLAVAASSDAGLLSRTGDAAGDGPHHAAIEYTWYDVVL